MAFMDNNREARMTLQARGRRIMLTVRKLREERRILENKVLELMRNPDSTVEQIMEAHQMCVSLHQKWLEASRKLYAKEQVRL